MMGILEVNDLDAEWLDANGWAYESEYQTLAFHHCEDGFIGANVFDGTCFRCNKTYKEACVEAQDES